MTHDIKSIIFDKFIMFLVQLNYAKETRWEYLPKEIFAKVENIISKLNHLDDIYAIMIAENYNDNFGPEDKLGLFLVPP